MSFLPGMAGVAGMVPQKWIGAHAFGDSITRGVDATVPATDGWVGLLSAQLGIPITNHGTDGDMVPDQTDDIYSNTPLALRNFSTLCLGVNDERQYGVNATKLGYYTSGIQALMARLGCGNVQNALTSGTYTGTWANTTVHGSIGKNSLTNGSKATFTVSGTVIYIAAIRQNSNAGTASITVDGVSAGTISTSAAAGMTTINGQTYGPQLIRITGLAAGNHTVEITVTSASGTGRNVYIDWVGGNDQTVKPHVFVGNVLYAQTYPSGGSDANVDSYNSGLATKISELVLDGLNIHAVNFNAAVDKTTDMDGAYHPQNAGHLKMKNAIKSVIASV